MISDLWVEWLCVAVSVVSLVLTVVYAVQVVHSIFWK